MGARAGGRPARHSRWSFALVGPGHAGTALAAALITRGRWPCVGVVARTSRAATAGAGRLGGAGLRTADRPAPALAGARLVIVAVRDADIASVAGALAAAGDWGGRVVIHLSGSLPASVLAPLRQRGARVASCHPIMTFPGGSKRPSPLPIGTPFGIEGDSEALAACADLVAAVSGRLVRVPVAGKVLYHVAATLAGNLSVALLGAGAEVLAAAGVDGAESLLEPLARESLAAAARLGAAEALTGPVARGDAATVAAHVAALQAAGLPAGVRAAHAAASLLALLQVRSRRPDARPPPADLDATERVLLEALRLAGAAQPRPGRRRA